MTKGSPDEALDCKVRRVVAVSRRGSVAAVVASSMLACATAMLMASCGDPVHDVEVKALGPENAAVPPGEFHRAGQPCATCHAGLGPATKKFSIAGTVFNNDVTSVGEDKVEVQLIDSLGFKPPGKILTNCVGNFFLTSDVWDPAFPVLVQIRKGENFRMMGTHIGRERSCGKCHTDPASYDSPGHIHIKSGETMDPVAECPVSPDLNARSTP